MEECSRWFHRWREDWWVPEETRHLLHARNGTKESGQCPLGSHLLDVHPNFQNLNILSLIYFPRNKYFNILTLNVDIRTWSILISADCVSVAPRSYQFKRGRSKVVRGKDTSRLTTITWQAYWRTIQTAFLLKSELRSLAASRPQRRDEGSVNPTWLGMETLAMQRLSIFKTSFFFFLFCTLLWLLVLYYIEWIATVLWNPFFFFYCLLIHDNRRTGKRGCCNLTVKMWMRLKCVNIFFFFSWFFFFFFIL